MIAFSSKGTLTKHRSSAEIRLEAADVMTVEYHWMDRWVVQFRYRRGERRRRRVSRGMVVQSRSNEVGAATGVTSAGSE